MKKYQGHRSYNAWNVSLWLNNDEDYYNDWCWMAEELSFEKALNLLMNMLPKKTPDGAVFNRLSVKLAIESNWSK